MLTLHEQDSPWRANETALERDKYERRVASFVYPVIKKLGAQTVLEVGAGNGQGTRLLRQLGLDAQAVDPNFRHNISEEFPFFKRASGLYLPYGLREFDLSFSLDVIEHVGTTGPDLQPLPGLWRLRRQFVDELCRVTCDMVVITTANKRFPFDEHGSRVLGGFRPHSIFQDGTLSADELKRLFKRNGFALEAYLDPRGFFEMERLRRRLGPTAAKLGDWWLHACSNRLLGASVLNPHLFMAFRRL
ncbi:MAG: hypothetical protein U5L74_07545 [Ideonella sp.]|nr:hypothetical protein [Ideonella sp.]